MNPTSARRPKMQPSLNSRQRGGFTLLQTLVSAVVGAVLVVAIAQMTGTGLRTMRESGGRLISASKMHDVRSQLAADFDLVPSPALTSGLSLPPFSLLTQDRECTLRLLQPSADADGWRMVTYRWTRSNEALTRTEQPLNAGSDDAEPEPNYVAAGVQRITFSCLENPADDHGPASWTAADRVPAALSCRITLSGVRTEGEPEAALPSGGQGRDYVWLLPLPGGGAL
jgi:type II secretory pathway component PulJ